MDSLRLGAKVARSSGAQEVALISHLLRVDFPHEAREAKRLLRDAHKAGECCESQAFAEERFGISKCHHPPSLFLFAQLPLFKERRKAAHRSPNLLQLDEAVVANKMSGIAFTVDTSSSSTDPVEAPAVESDRKRPSKGGIAFTVQEDAVKVPKPRMPVPTVSVEKTQDEVRWK